MGISSSIAAGLTALGIGADTAATVAPILATTGEFAAGGAALGGIAGGGQGALKGLEAGALTGFGAGAGGALGGVAGIGSTAGSALGGAAGGALGGAVTGGNPLTSAIGGGISGGLAGFSGGGTPSAAASGAAGASAPATGAAAATAPGDLTSGFPTNLGDIYGGTSPNLASSIGTSAITPSFAEQLSTPAVGANFGGPVTFSGGTPTGPATGPLSQSAFGGAPTTPGGGGIGGFVNNLSQGNFGAAFEGIPASAYLGAAGLGYEALKGQPPLPNLSNLNTEAGILQQEGNALLNPLSGGPLPAGAQASINEGVQSAQAAIRSQFASMGLTGSSAEQEALTQAAQQGIEQQFAVAQSMAQTGANLTGLDLSTYQNIMQQQLASDKEFSDAITQFATSLAGGGPKIQIGGTA